MKNSSLWSYPRSELLDSLAWTLKYLNFDQICFYSFLDHVAFHVTDVPIISTKITSEDTNKEGFHDLIDDGDGQKTFGCLWLVCLFWQGFFPLLAYAKHSHLEIVLSWKLSNRDVVYTIISHFHADSKHTMLEKPTRRK